MTGKTAARKASATPALLPRFIRLRDAPFYLVMDRNRFNAEVRQFLTRIPIGRQGVAFDRLELDAWVDDLAVLSQRHQSAGRGGAPPSFRCQALRCTLAFAPTSRNSVLPPI